MENQIQAMQEFLNGAYTALQEVTIQATHTNVTNMINALNNIKVVYNTLSMMAKETRSKADNNEVTEDE